MAEGDDAPPPGGGDDAEAAAHAAPGGEDGASPGGQGPEGGGLSVGELMQMPVEEPRKAHGDEAGAKDAVRRPKQRSSPYSAAVVAKPGARKKPGSVQKSDRQFEQPWRALIPPPCPSGQEVRPMRAPGAGPPQPRPPPPKQDLYDVAVLHATTPGDPLCVRRTQPGALPAERQDPRVGVPYRHPHPVPMVLRKLPAPLPPHTPPALHALLQHECASRGMLARDEQNYRLRLISVIPRDFHPRRRKHKRKRRRAPASESGSWVPATSTSLALHIGETDHVRAVGEGAPVLVTPLELRAGCTICSCDFGGVRRDVLVSRLEERVPASPTHSDGQAPRYASHLQPKPCPPPASARDAPYARAMAREPRVLLGAPAARDGMAAVTPAVNSESPAVVGSDGDASSASYRVGRSPRRPARHGGATGVVHPRMPGRNAGSRGGKSTPGLTDHRAELDWYRLRSPRTAPSASASRSVEGTKPRRRLSTARELHQFGTVYVPLPNLHR
eukprot:TRINITY_DN12825_c0_g1_i6.p1 TRINITY_DN12825_c0_g1~~TRINITY_DN12825_c0_g1_i6.p1  ORF type:complete len:515 (+),score=92.85 TRINITY_DN12825_c0_g1_i6:46-1545(+)